MFYRSKVSNIVPASYDDTPQLTGYKHSARCQICVARGRDNLPLREQFDNYAITATAKDGVKWLLDHGVSVSERVVSAHLFKHAPYVALAKANGTKKMQKMIVRIHQEKTEASTAVQRIIDIGDTKIQEGEMPVTEKLYIEALKIQSKSGNKSSMDTEIETMDEDFINKIKRLNDGNST